MFKQNDVITVACMAGEITGKYVSDNADSITLKDPRILTQTEQGIGYAKSICMSGQEEPKEATIRNYLFVLETNSEFVKAYHQTVSGLVI